MLGNLIASNKKVSYKPNVPLSCSSTPLSIFRNIRPHS